MLITDDVITNKIVEVQIMLLDLVTSGKHSNQYL